MKYTISLFPLMWVLLFVPIHSYAWEDACSAIANMVDYGAHVTFANYKGRVLEGNGFFDDDGDKWVSIHCPPEHHSNPNLGDGVIIIETDWDYLNIKRGDEVHYRGTLKRWKYREYIDTKRRYIELYLEKGGVWK